MNRKYERDLKTERVNLSKQHAEAPDDDTYQKYASTKRERESLSYDRAKGIQIRAKCTHIELNEHSSKS